MSDERCQDCGRTNVVWFTDNALWNLVVGGPDVPDDPGGILCPMCFIERAEKHGIKPTAWKLGPEGVIPMQTHEALSWQEIVEHCSRLHTTRTRPRGSWPGAEMREGSKTLAVLVDGRPATIIPTRMHEPGFYWRYEDIPGPPSAEGVMRSEDDIALLQRLTAEGRVLLGGEG